MEYPKKVLDKIKVLDEYKENKELNIFNIFHLYSKELAYPNGFFDSRFFELIGFNSEIMEKRSLGRHDGIDFWESYIISVAQVYADGAFLLRFEHMVETTGNTQMIYVNPIERR